MSFSRGSFGSSTPLQPQTKPLYPSLNVQTPATPSPSLQQKPPPRPASVPLSFGGRLSHSASTPSLQQAFQNQNANQAPADPQQPSSQQPFSTLSFSPSPQPPLTTSDLSGNSPFAKPPPQWGQQPLGGTGMGGHGLSRSHSQQFMPQNPLGERRFLPSHLRSYSPERSSPLAKENVVRDPMPSPKEKRRVSFGSVTTFGHPSNANFGGSGFGTPKDEPKKSRRDDDEFQDMPPSASIYDTGRSSPFTRQTEQRQPDIPNSPSPQPEQSLFSSTATTSPSKRTDPTPVILFGFPTSHSPFIIREYEKYGPILEHFSSSHTALPTSVLPPREILQGGNWIRITYADPVSAARAVATNGQLMGGSYMVGVIYAPNPTEQITEEVEPVRRDDTRTPTSGTGERKMNVVRGASMFVKKDERIKDVGWGTWVWNNLFVGERKEINVGVVAGTQSPVGKALRGLSETVFGF